MTRHNQRGGAAGTLIWAVAVLVLGAAVAQKFFDVDVVGAFARAVDVVSGWI